MNIAIVTGAAGLVGGESVRYFAGKGFTVAGIDNDMRKVLFGAGASTKWQRIQLQETLGHHYIHYDADIRDEKTINAIFKEYGNDIKIVIHTAAQPSHDRAALDPQLDFTINANGTQVLLEATRSYCPKAVFIQTSTNKVYGDTPNFLPFIELEKRYELNSTHPWFKNGIDETMNIDQSKHSLFGVSKLSGDVLAQEYGRYFGLKTGIFRGGCITGPGHSGAELHGFLAYLMKCTIEKKNYTIYGYKGKQVRDNIHSYDLVSMFWHFFNNPRPGEVYNAGGSRHCNCSVLEAIELCENITGNKLNKSYTDTNRIGDHIWYISDTGKFKQHYPEWYYAHSLESIMQELYAGLTSRSAIHS
jgi:CDP-paratose 2-epimerase